MLVENRIRLFFTAPAGRNVRGEFYIPPLRGWDLMMNSIPTNVVAPLGLFRNFKNTNQ